MLEVLDGDPEVVLVRTDQLAPSSRFQLPAWTRSSVGLVVLQFDMVFDNQTTVATARASRPFVHSSSS